MSDTDWRGRCTLVAVDGCCYEHGDALFWCTHWHANADEANSCPWVPDDSSLRICIVFEYEFDPAACSPCDPHGLHPGECNRCLAVRCVHLNAPEECERCVALASGLLDAEPAGDTRQDEPSSGDQAEAGDASSDSPGEAA